ncbi:nucleotide pyrophosphatase/phosphodiesterase-like protein, partial [Tanacetum coccineum]
YSTDYGMFHFCIADSEHDCREGSEQCAWIEKCLTSVDRQKQPWLIFSANRVLGYSSKSWLTSESVIGVVVAINDIVLFQGGAVKEVRSIVIDDPEGTKRGPEIAFDSREDDMSGVVKSRLEAPLNWLMRKFRTEIQKDALYDCVEVLGVTWEFTSDECVDGV